MHRLSRLRFLAAAVALVAAACTAAGAEPPQFELATGGATSQRVDASTTTSTSRPMAVSPVGVMDQTRVEALEYRVIEAPVEPQPPRAGYLQPRDITAQAYTPFATVGNLTLVHPSTSVETIGFHESNHDGAQQMEPLETAVEPFTMPSRDRGTGSRTAADVVVEPGVAIVSPITGTVLRAGSYTLYCDYRDHYAVIEPDAEPGWEVKILHFLDLQVSSGDRVEAGVTVIGSGPRPLAFRSQVDDATAAPSWPHIHIEVVDPSIPDRPSGISC